MRFTIAQDIPLRYSIEKFSKFEKKIFSIFWASGVVPRWAGGGHLGGLMMEIEKSLRWRQIYWPKVSIAAPSVQIG